MISLAIFQLKFRNMQGGYPKLNLELNYHAKVEMEIFHVKT